MTGLPYDPSKDPQAASRLSEHHLGRGMGEGTETAKRLEHEEVGEEHKGFGEKLKERFHLGSH